MIIYHCTFTLFRIENTQWQQLPLLICAHKVGVYKKTYPKKCIKGYQYILHIDIQNIYHE